MWMIYMSAVKKHSIQQYIISEEEEKACEQLMSTLYPRRKKFILTFYLPNRNMNLLKKTGQMKYHNNVSQGIIQEKIKKYFTMNQ